MSAESKQDRWLDVKDQMGERRLQFGRHLAYWYYHSPRRLLHCMSYYKFAAKLIGPGKHVLDVGCGEGIGTWLLAVENGFAHGVDLDDNAISCGQQNFGHDSRIRFTCENFLDAEPREWEAVTSFDVIEHVHAGDMPAFWTRFTENLTHDGILVVGTPNITTEQFASPIRRAGHINLYSGERLEEEARRYFDHVFMFAGNDEVVHTGFLPMAHYLIAVCCRKRTRPAG